VAAVAAALRVLDMPVRASTLPGLLAAAVPAWRARWPC
jgi:hypothetical protein